MKGWLAMSEYLVINGHRSDCAYIRSLIWSFEEHPCDCDSDDDLNDLLDDEVYADGDYDW